jgi:hypothetical protein
MIEYAEYKRISYTRIRLTGKKMAGLFVSNSYQLMGINPSKSVHFIVPPLTFSLIFANYQKIIAVVIFMDSNSMKASHVKKIIM